MEPINVTRRQRLVSMNLEPTAAVVYRASALLLVADLATVDTDNFLRVLVLAQFYRRKNQRAGLGRIDPFKFHIFNFITCREHFELAGSMAV